MQEWIKLSIRIGTFGFLKEFRPEDPYITSYLTGPVMNINETVVMEIFYGTMTACEVAYYTYIYVKVDKQHYQAVTSHMRAAALTGRFMSGLTGQTLLLLNIMDIAELNHLTFIGMLAALIWAISLPSMKHSLYFHRDSENVQCNDISTDGSIKIENVNEKKQHGKYKAALFRLWSDFKHAYTNPYVIKWSLWWALATCGYQQVMSYVQLLWTDIAGKENAFYNGAVEALYTIISAFSAFMFGRCKADWSRPDRGELLLGVLTLTEGSFLLWSSFSHSIWEGYIVYIVFGALYHIMMTVSNSEVARHIKSDSYALIFGVNTFISLVLQTSLTYTVAADGGLKFNIREQFVVYGSYFCCLGILFLCKCVFSILFDRFNKSSYNL
ncbi:thiamine transporter 1-like isoform X2 [Lycorma delicatula]|uniref:thiamine transporter 1-like isoform X2 n=1 Tax=Lycorma delicatula TaxID=130591 RepID=UPI003F518C9C